MSFFTALTGLKGAQTDISTTSNNIANVGSNGFKKSRAEFGDIFGSTPLQSQTVGQGTSVKGISQQFGQGNITTSSNTLDMAISGQGFFAMEAGGVAAQTVYTRNGSFNVDDSGFIVDSNGQFLLGYPVDSDGAVADKTLAGATKLELKSEFGEPKRTENISMGVNLSSSDKVLASDNIFNTTDPETYSSTSAVTIFDSAGNPQSATVYYLKTQQATDLEPNFKYDTKVFVDGVEIMPNLTKAVNPQEEALFIDKFGQQTTRADMPDPAYILQGKGFPLYKADDLGAAVKSTPATMSSNALESFLGDGRTIKITTDPGEFKSTMEYQKLAGEASPVPGTFWGKDFLLLDFDKSGPISIDIPPGTYNGTQLAEAVEIAARNAFGDDKKIKLEAGEDNFFSLDLKKSTGDGLSSGLATPIVVDLHAKSFVLTQAEAEAGMVMDDFLQHAQVRMNDEMNKYIQTGETADQTRVEALEKADGKLFKKIRGNSIPQTTTSPPIGYDILELGHKNDTQGTGVTNRRFVAYSNPPGDQASYSVEKFGERNKPTIAAYDVKSTLIHDQGANTDPVVDANKNPVFFIVKDTTDDVEGNASTVNDFPDKPEVVRFFQTGTAAKATAWTEFFGTEEIAVKSVIEDPNNANNWKVTLDFDMGANGIPDSAVAAEQVVTILAKPSRDVEAYFESSEGLVEGVKNAAYSNRIVVQEAGASATRAHAGATTNATGALVWSTANTSATYKTDALGASVDNSMLLYGLQDDGDGTTADIVAPVVTTNWVDDRDPPIKIGYDEKAQRLTFDGDNSKLGLGTGIGMTSFTAYSAALDAGESDIGIPAFGNNKDISLESDDLFLGNSFINDGPDVMVTNKRYGMEVNFDTVGTKFDIKSGKTGEQLAENSAVGV
ncbi:flagellar hook-basal body complex protein, partial [Planktomarina sp.]|nr:flagellar hook-basal body complex protein [Planktomarina sp.]